MKKQSQKYLERLDFTWSEDSIRLINTPSSSAKQVFFYVQETGYFKTSPPYFTERANLNSFLILHTLSGEGSLSYLDSTYTIGPQDTFFINCMEHHMYRCISAHDWEFLWLHFNGSSALGYYDEFTRNGFHILNDSDDSFIVNTLREILQFTQQKDYRAEIQLSKLITDILTQLLLKGSRANPEYSVMPAYLTAMLSEIEHHFQEQLCLDDLSRKIGVSKYHLSREFKRYIGTPPNEYLIITRLNHAKELLKYTQQSVEEIAFTCGFNHVSHFISLFKKHESITPLQYRKDWGE
ncbi:MAG: AraC family transcriptional regulator [Lachnospiraceae bacterium]|nr:AraC family transcriptional regulator [Lachnospiraceae bacterium]